MKYGENLTLCQRGKKKKIISLKKKLTENIDFLWNHKLFTLNPLNKKIIHELTEFYKRFIHTKLNNERKRFLTFPDVFLDEACLFFIGLQRVT